MKIALVHNQAAGGAKRVIFEHARELRARGHAIDAYVVSTATEAYLPLAPLCERVYTYDVPAAANGSSRFKDRPLLRGVATALSPDFADRWAARAAVDRHLEELNAIALVYDRMARDISRRGYDVAYVHQCRIANSPGVLRQLEVPSVYYCHDTLRYVEEWSFEEHAEYDALSETGYWFKMKGNLVPRPMMRFLNRLEQDHVAATRAATIVLANSWFSREAIVRTTGVNPRVCYPGVDAEFFCPDPAAARERVVLSVGTLAANKRHDFILEAISTIPADRRPAMEIVGYELAYGEAEYGPYGRKLAMLATERGVDLRIIKEVSDSVLRDRYRRAAVFAFAPALEPFGIVPLEAMACGTPAVGVAEGGLRESIKDGLTGLLTERDHREFGAALDRLLSEPALAKEMGERGRAEASTWTWDRSADRLETHLNSVLASPRRSRVSANPPVAFVSGFYPEERDESGLSWRWMGSEGVITIRNTGCDMLLTLAGRAPALPIPPTLKIEFNGEPLDQLLVSDDLLKSYAIAPAMQSRGDRSTLRITTSQTFVPRKADPHSGDARRLGFAVYRLSWESHD